MRYYVYDDIDSCGEFVSRTNHPTGVVRLLPSRAWRDHEDFDYQKKTALFHGKPVVS